jgi:hypothetical protein
MYIIELILSLQVNDFSIPERYKVNEAVNSVHECQQSFDYQVQCANVIDKLIDAKYRYGGIYANYQ